MHSSFLETVKNKETHVDSLSWNPACLKNVPKTGIIREELLNTYSALHALLILSPLHTVNTDGWRSINRLKDTQLVNDDIGN